MKNIIFGFHSIESAIVNKPDDILRLVVDNKRQDNRHESLINLAKSNHINIEYSSNPQLDKLTNNANHQGVVAYIKAVKLHIDLKQLLLNLRDKKNSIILVLDGITDPHNLGAIIRSSDCFGVDAILIPQNNSANTNNSTVAKVSSGAVNNIPVIIVNNLNRAIEQLKANEFWIAGTSLGENSISLFDFKPDKRLAWVMGNEGAGIRRLVAENCDYLVTIPMFGNTQSLNVSVAAGVVLAYTQFMHQASATSL